MTSMKDIVKMSDKEITELVCEKREEVRGTRFGSAQKSAHTIRAAKTDIARGLTELNTRNKKTAHADAK